MTFPGLAHITKAKMMVTAKVEAPKRAPTARSSSSESEVATIAVITSVAPFEKARSVAPAIASVNFK